MLKDEITALALDFLAREETIVKALAKRDAKTTADIGRDAFGAAIDALRDAERKTERLMLSRRHIWEQIMPEADAQQSGLERNAFLAGADAVLGLFEKWWASHNGFPEDER